MGTIIVLALQWCGRQPARMTRQQYLDAEGRCVDGLQALTTLPFGPGAVQIEGSARLMRDYLDANHRQFRAELDRGVDAWLASGAWTLARKPLVFLAMIRLETARKQIRHFREGRAPLPPRVASIDDLLRLLLIDAWQDADRVTRLIHAVIQPK